MINAMQRTKCLAQKATRQKKIYFHNLKSRMKKIKRGQKGRGTVFLGFIKWRRNMF